MGSLQFFLTSTWVGVGFITVVVICTIVKKLSPSHLMTYPLSWVLNVGIKLSLLVTWLRGINRQGNNSCGFLIAIPLKIRQKIWRYQGAHTYFPTVSVILLSLFMEKKTVKSGENSLVLYIGFGLVCLQKCMSSITCFLFNTR